MESNEKSFKTPLTGKNIDNVTKKNVCVESNLAVKNRVDSYPAKL